MSDSAWDAMSDVALPHKIRVSVSFGNSSDGIVIPMLSSATVKSLQAEALRRVDAMELQVQLPRDGLVIRANNLQGPILFGDDTLEDCLALPQAVVWIGALQETPTVATGLVYVPDAMSGVTYDTPGATSGFIYVRWITPGKALNYTTLSAIPELKGIALERVFKHGNESPTVNDLGVELFLSSCPLVITSKNTTLGYLGCDGNIKEPLNLFVVPRQAAWSNNEEKMHLDWGFEASDRGIAIFTTCLRVLMNEIHSKPTVFRRLLKIFFEITHFPPALEALQSLASRNRMTSSAVLVLASCFRELSLRMVPGCLIGGQIVSALEGSRQIFAWIFEQVGTIVLTAESRGYYAAPDESVQVVEFEATGPASQDAPSANSETNEQNSNTTALTAESNPLPIRTLSSATIPSTISADGAAPDPRNLDFLRNNPQFQTRRQVVQQRPDMLEPILQQVEASNPQLSELIARHREQFLELLMENNNINTSANSEASENTSEGTASEDTMAQNTESITTDRSRVRVRIRTHVSCKEDVGLLAQALWGSYDSMTNNYVDFRDRIDNPISHKHTPLVDSAHFESLILVANRSPRFLMLAPQEISDRHAQGIVLCKEGFVSLYSINIGHFKSLASQLENVITGVEILKGDKPGEALLLALKPVIQQRKTNGTWEIDNWELRDEITRPDDASPDEAILICADLSVSMNQPLLGDWAGDQNTLSRLDETKQVFRNIIARILGYQLTMTHVGLVTFSGYGDTQVAAPLSKVRKDFKEKLEAARVISNTALWDALMQCHNVLTAFKAQNPNTRLRIVVLTDGEDNESLHHPSTVCKALYNANIVLDSVVIGTDETYDLFRISKHTGGYAFNPSSRLLLFQTFLLEPFLDISARPEIKRIAPLMDSEEWDFEDEEDPKSSDMETVYDFPPCKPHELEVGNFISLSTASRFFNVKASTSLLGQTHVDDHVPSSRPLGAERLSLSSGRIFLEEMKYMITSPHPSMDIYVNESDMSFWKVVMKGPAASSYENGTFVLFVHMIPSYPQSAPAVRFITPILHPNITKHGRICHQVLSDGWKTNYHIFNVLQNIYGLLTSPETDDAVDELATLKFWTDRETADAEIRKYVDKFAKRDRAEWKEEIERR